MAKCIKDAKGNMQRVDDETARKLVSSGAWKYISKDEYKEAVKK